MATLAISAIFTLQSCEKDKNTVDPSIYYPNALVTLKTTADNKFYMQFDDNTTVLPVNIKENPYKNKTEIRALANIAKVNEPHEGFSDAVHVHWVDSVRTKAMAPNMPGQNVSIYGNDPIELVKDFVTIVEDEYLTVRFRTRFSGGTYHILNLVPGDKPFEVVLHHNAQGDTFGQFGDGIMAFRLDLLPETTEPVDLTVKWESFSGPKSHVFKYVPRKK